MKKKIFCIEILQNDVYIEYTDGDVEYISFTKAKKMIYLSHQEQFRFSCVDDEKSNNFLNNLLARYKMDHDMLTIRQ